MVYQRKTAAKVISGISSAVGIISAFGLGHAIKSYTVPQVCQTVTAGGLGLMSAICQHSGIQYVFTQAAANSSILAMDCVPGFFMDTNLVGVCLGTTSGLIGFSIVGLLAAAALKKGAKLCTEAV